MSFWQNEKKVKVLIGVLAMLVIVLVSIINRFTGIKVWAAQNLMFDFQILPLINACLNFSVGISLLISFYFIRKRNIKRHQFFNTLACVLSTLFLLNYVFYHFIAYPTAYGGEGWLKTLYFFILGTHVVLSALSFPFIVLTFYYGSMNMVEKHRSLAKKVYPIWLYVAFTGVAVYLFLQPYY
ncbi:MAG: DUF420 domain-containing protein [Chitinophagales bacterium]|jgi:putative membrane protein|nr:DUF420 domain-containing protein [Chitinophagales bacterium]